MPADNERFGATAAGNADLKGSAGMPPLRQAEKTSSRKQYVLRRKYNQTAQWTESENKKVTSES